MPTVVEIDARTGKRTSRDVALTPEQIAAGDAERSEQAAAKAREDARTAAVTALETRGSGSVTREEIEALKAAVRALV